MHSDRLFDSELVRIVDVRCRPADSCAGAEECVSANNIVFLRRGFFVHSIGRERVWADANQVLLFGRQTPYRVSHPIAGGDDCTSFTFAPEVLGEAFGSYNPAVRERPENPFRVRRLPCPPPVCVSLHRLRMRLRASSDVAADADPLSVEETAMRLLDAVARNAPASSGVHQRRGPDTLAAQRELAENARAVLAERFNQPVSLAEVAQRVHSSPYHLARVFRRQTGMPIHRYLLRLRLRSALEQLADANSRDLTDLALSTGFSSHSHFSDAFRREFECSPRSLRRTAPRAGCAK